MQSFSVHFIFEIFLKTILKSVSNRLYQNLKNIYYSYLKLKFLKTVSQSKDCSTQNFLRLHFKRWKWHFLKPQLFFVFFFLSIVNNKNLFTIMHDGYTYLPFWISSTLSITINRQLRLICAIQQFFQLNTYNGLTFW